MAERHDALTHDAIADLAAGYVLDALTPDEMERVREHLTSCRLPHPELEALGAVVPALARSVPQVPPPAGLGDRIMAAARAEAAAAGTTTAVAPAALPVQDSSVAPRPAIGRTGRPARAPGLLDLFRRPIWAMTAVAAVLAIAVLGAWNLQLQSQVSDLTAYRTGVLAVLDTAARPGSQVAVLAGPTAGGATGIAAVSSDGRVVVAMRNLSPTANTEVYEAWLIGSNGTPLPVGSFTVGSAGTGTLAATAMASGAEAGVVVALTREPGPGATTPTLPILASGTAQARAG